MAPRSNRGPKAAARARQKRRIGDAPGQMVPLVDAGPAHLHLFAFDADSLVEVEPATARDVDQRAHHGVRWVDVDGFGSEEGWKLLQRQLGLSALAVEDAMTNQRAKAERFVEHDFLLIHMVRLEGEQLLFEQLSLFFKDGYVLTAQEGVPGDVLEPVRSRIRTPEARIRQRDSKYLAYAIADCVVDHYFPVVDDLAERLQKLDLEVFDDPAPDIPARLTRLRRDINQLRRTLRPARDALVTLLPNGRVGQSVELQPFISDLMDHTHQLLDELDHLREQTAALMDLYLSLSGQRMNEIMRTLTVISMVFMPLTFIAGLYGMNFDTRHPWNMPELRFAYGYPVVMLVMATVAGALILAFRRQGWLRIRKVDEAGRSASRSQME